MTRLLHLRPAVLVLMLSLLAGGALAQGSTDRAAREREQLRRAQAALRDVTAERDTLKAEKAALAAQQEQAAKDTAAAKAQATALRPPLQRAYAEVQTLRAELAALGALKLRGEADAAAKQDAATLSERALQRQLATAQRELADRTASNQRVAALLEASTTALRDAETRNRTLHALGLELVDRWRRKTPAEALAQTETLIGLAGVRAEDEAEALRSRIDALLLPAAAAAR